MELIITLCIIVSASLIGVIFTQKWLRTYIDRHNTTLSIFSAGVLFIAGILMFRESIHVGNILIALFSTGGGALFFWGMHKIFPEGHSHTHEHKVSKQKAYRMLLGDAIHNIGDGIVIATAFMIDIRLGIIAGIGIFIHELLQEISEFFLLKRFGFSTKKALLANGLVALTIFLGAGIAVVVGDSPVIQAVLLGISAGAFLFVVIHDINPITLIRKENILYNICIFLLGVGMLILIKVLIPHPHDHTHVHKNEPYDLHDNVISEHYNHTHHSHE